jgi:transmembrane sensor
LTETVKTEAAAWMARLGSNRRTDADEQDFRAWLGSDPAHAAAFEELSAIWDVAGTYPRDMRGHSVEKRPTLARRAVAAGLVALPVAGAGLILLRPAQAETYSTKVGEQKKITLSDESSIFLDTNTRLEVSFDRQTRLVVLQYGRANFEVATDKDRPFVVKAADSHIIAAESNFDVRYDKSQVSVVLFSGQATVKDAGKLKALAPGERLATENHAITLDKPKLTSVQAWRSGRTIFENTKLSDAVAEMNRYNAIEMQIRDRDIADMRVSGIYRNGDSLAFANTIAKLMPVKVQETPTGVYLLEDDSRRAKKGG